MSPLGYVGEWQQNKFPGRHLCKITVSEKTGGENGSATKVNH